MNKPIGLSEYNLKESRLDNIKGPMPIVEEIETDVQKLKEGDSK